MHHLPLILSTAVNGAMLYALVRSTDRADARVDRVLERISTAPRIEVRPTEPDLLRVQGRRYIPDTPEADPAWNDFVEADGDE